MSVVATIIGGLSSFGASTVVSHLGMQCIPQNASKFTKVLCALGITGLAGAAGSAAGNYMETKLEEGEEAVKGICNLIKNKGVVEEEVTEEPRTVTIDLTPEMLEKLGITIEKQKEEIAHEGA